ncbi:hypothetical protein Vretimale_7449 [Volvox reticuliferus]|uniref:Uncharacterized protein n=1 Tax=Volvox reticuliferus TaxID=1737510 RepID=A0A8J4CF57_9CHLO|nr:hypothetical protein Vretifemale_7562 [Volvox reticuliferus]GIM02662.1 hypothetical protein Vretimale_7449 [Volvox reticuliferus]
MITSFGRLTSGVSSAFLPSTVQTFLQQSAGALQELQARSVTPNLTTSECSSGGSIAPSTSYTPLPDPVRHLHLYLHHHRNRLFPGHHHHYQQLNQRTESPPAPPGAFQQFQQLRSYRIPNRVAPPKVAYSVRSGRPAPQPWPEFEPVKAPQGEVRWHRNVVRFPPEVSVQLEGSTALGPAGGGSGDGAPNGVRTLVLCGKAGTIRLNLQELDPTGLLAFRLIHLPSGSTQQQQQRRSLLVLASPSKDRFDTANEQLNKAIRGVMSGYLVGLTVKGVGYRMEPVEDPTGEVASRVPKLTYAQVLRRSRAPGGAAPKPYYFESAGEEKQNVTFPYSKPVSAIRLKVGYSRTVVYPLPPHIRAFCLKPTLLYLYGLELDELQRVAAEICAIRKPNPYTGNGLQYVDEVVKLKQRARSK